VLARIGGDEFAALLPRADAATACKVAEDLLDALRSERIEVPGGRDRRISASIGVAAFEAAEGVTGEDVLVSADLAMYDAKEAGRNQVAVYATDDQAQARMKGRITWAERIAVALEQERFTLVAQPIVDLASGRTTQIEVLLRMLGDDDELIPPGAFLYIAERLGMIGQIDRMVVTRAIRALAQADAGDLQVHVNLSGASVGDPKVLATIEHELRAGELDPRRLVFEITETAAIANIAKARRFSEQLSELGCGFALDDFGAGFGSFYYLKHIRFDYLKIDGEFVHNCRHSHIDRVIIAAVVEMSRGLGGRTVAEHVVDDETVALLSELGVDFGQGYHLGVPAPLAHCLPAAARAEH
jgi:EAL domain-containing protein (putative c-di-GMP-specific phosphodiesterase class I)